MTFRLSTTARNASAAAVAALLDAGAGPGVVEIRTGAQPATPQTAASGTLLATVTLADPAFGGPVAGVVSWTDPAAVAAVAAGTAGWFRAKDSNGNAVFDGAIGSELTLDNTVLAVGQFIDLGAFSFTIPQ